MFDLSLSNIYVCVNFLRICTQIYANRIFYERNVQPWVSVPLKKWHLTKYAAVNIIISYAISLTCRNKLHDLLKNEVYHTCISYDTLQI